MHFTPTSNSWLNPIKRWFRDVICNHIRNGVFRSVEQLEQAIKDNLDHHNANPKTSVRIGKAEGILEKVKKARAAVHKISFE